MTGKIKKRSFAVLLAAYNGIEWIDEQIDSILSQVNVDVTIYVSVDWSSDSTYELVDRISLASDKINILPYGQRFGGAAPNFFRLIKDVDFSRFDYVSLSDQDDIWNSDKLNIACESLESSEYDAYSSNVIAFWSDGADKLLNKAQPQVKYDFLFESAGPGCTFVFSKKLAIDIQRKLIEVGERSNEILLHDWFVYSFARTNGYKWYIDKKPSMEYRQHLTNQVGANVGLKSIYIRAKLILGGEGFKKVISQALILEQQNLKPIELLIRNNRLSFLNLAFYSFNCRRKLLEKIFFMIICFIMVIKGSIKDV